MMTLEVERLTVRYGGVVAVEDVSLGIEAGRLVGLIGPNGAGKTTLIDAITGFTPSNGSVRFAGAELSRTAPHRRSRLGLARTWQSVELFDDLTVREHVLVAEEAVGGPVVRSARRAGKRSSEHIDWALGLLGLSDAADRMPGELAHGQRKLVGIARALAGQPKVILLDEPAAGLDTGESELLGRRLRRVLQEGIGLLLVDHDVRLVASTCEYLYALDFGKLIARGPCHEVLQNPEVVAAYLGAGGAAAGEQAVGALEAHR